MRVSELIMYILAVLSAGYGIFVRAAGSGTSFFLVWFALAVVLILFGISLHIRLWKKVPVWGRRILMGIVVLGLAAFVIVEGCVISHMEDRGEDGLDYIIVLGAQVTRTDRVRCYSIVWIAQLNIWRKIRIPIASFPVERARMNHSRRHRGWRII